jgi:hypothetical protein
MDKTHSPPPAADTMQGVFVSQDALRDRGAASAAAPGSPPADRLPPTRAARLARSRGVFFALCSRARLGHWVRQSVGFVVATLVLVASAQFALPAFDAATANGNPGPALLASATSAPSFLTRPVR